MRNRVSPDFLSGKYPGKIFHILLGLILLSILIGCASAQKAQQENFWISGFKTMSSAGAGEQMSLLVYKGENLAEARWEIFSSPIEGFVFEKGFLRKISVLREERDNVPADASTWKYTLIEELERQVDPRNGLEGEWILAAMNDRPLNRMVVLPDLEIRLETMQFSGSGGCNSYTGRILELNLATMALGPSISTKKACFGEYIEQEYFEHLALVTSFAVNGDTLELLNSRGERVLSFLRRES